MPPYGTSKPCIYDQFIAVLLSAKLCSEKHAARDDETLSWELTYLLLCRAIKRCLVNTGLHIQQNTDSLMKLKDWNVRMVHLKVFLTNYRQQLFLFSIFSFLRDLIPLIPWNSKLLQFQVSYFWNAFAVFCVQRGGCRLMGC